MIIQKYKFLLKQLIIRDFKVKYKRSFLGVIWSLLNPLLLTLVQYLVFSNFFRYEIENYATYLLIGVVMFNYFSDAMSQSIYAILSNASLLTKVRLPKEIFPLAKVLSCGINFLLSLIPMFLVAFFSGCRIHFSIFMLPYNLFFFLLFILGMSFILSSTMVFFRDISFIWNVISMLWMYSTPIFYPVTILPEWMQNIERLNPLWHFINFFRIVLLEGKIPNINTFIGVSFSGIIVFFIGYLLFNKLKKSFVLYL